jgi:hypothetical protein
LSSVIKVDKIQSDTGTINVASKIEFPAGTVSAPSIFPTGDTNTGIFFPAADTIAFAEGGAEAMRIDSSGNVGIGTSSPAVSGLEIARATGSASPTPAELRIATTTNASDWSTTDPWGRISFYSADGSTGGAKVHAAIETVATGTSGGASNFNFLVTDSQNGTLFPVLSFQPAGTNNTQTVFYAGGSGTERMRITSDGTLLVGKAVTTFSTAGIRFLSNGIGEFVADGDNPIDVNRLTSDGNLVNFYQASTLEGTISVSGTAVSYNGGHLSRWAQMLTKPDLLKGTVMSNLDEMNVYIAPTTYWTEEDELPEGVSVGDVKVGEHQVDNEQLNKVKVSDVEGDANVAGVFVNWDYDEAHSVDEINMAMTGDMIIRIAEGVTVQRGDLLMSAGDGTAKPQGDDIVRSKTIAKVTSTHVTCTYDDGSYCVPCVLMAC